MAAWFKDNWKPLAFFGLLLAASANTVVLAFFDEARSVLTISLALGSTSAAIIAAFWAAPDMWLRMEKMRQGRIARTLIEGPFRLIGVDGGAVAVAQGEDKDTARRDLKHQMVKSVKAWGRGHLRLSLYKIVGEPGDRKFEMDVSSEEWGSDENISENSSLGGFLMGVWHSREARKGTFDSDDAASCSYVAAHVPCEEANLVLVLQTDKKRYFSGFDVRAVESIAQVAGNSFNS